MQSANEHANQTHRPPSFKEAYCAHFDCPPERYEESLFWRAIFRHAVPLALIIRRFDPDFFHEDLDLIREVGAMSSQAIFRNEINYFYGRNLRDKRWLRTGLRVRISGNRMMHLWGKLMKA